MKTLFLIRHAKSDWSHNFSDHDRPLSGRGVKDAPNMGAFLQHNYPIPDLILSSSANRAISTARTVANKIGYELGNITIIENLYLASAQDILKEVWAVDNKAKTIFLFGHNTGISNLASHLSGNAMELKTCCVAVLKNEIDDWNTLTMDTCELIAYHSPKNI